MRTFAVNESNDIILGDDGNLAIATDQQAALIVCEQFIRATRGEMIHKMHRGMPYFAVTFGRNANVSQFEAAFRNRMSQIDQVSGVVDFNAEIANNELSYVATISTIYGEGVING